MTARVIPIRPGIAVPDRRVATKSELRAAREELEHARRVVRSTCAAYALGRVERAALVEAFRRLGRARQWVDACEGEVVELRMAPWVAAEERR